MSSFKEGEWLVNYVSSNPRELMIELTTSCNYNCIHCFRNTLLDSEINRDMEVEVFRDLVKQAIEAGVFKIALSGWGEPLTHPNILDFIHELKKYGFKVLVNTNGYLLPEYVEDLYKLGVDEIYVSVDSINEELYRIIRVGGNLSKVTEGLMKLKYLKLRDGSFKPEVHLQFTLTALNIQDLIALPEYVKKVAASQAIISNVIPLNRELEKKLAWYANEKCLKAIEELKDKLSKRVFEVGGKITLPNFTHVSDRRCPFISINAAFIRYDGGIAPCIEYAHSWKTNFMGVSRTLKKIVFGNITTEKLIDIWRKPEYVKFRFNAYFFRMPSCYECVLKNYCNLTLTNESDCWGVEPSCASCPYAHGIVKCPL